ncbi:MAG: metallophosphoesterase, partial [Alphaproteobacteria bacterium]
MPFARLAAALRGAARRPPRVPDGLVVYAIGDVHGRDDRLRELEGMLRADAARRSAARRLVVMLGDYVDRGPGSRAVLDHLCAPPPPGFERACLAGNHEQLMLAFLDDPGEAAPWLANGGAATLASYGVAGAAALRAALPAAHLAFLRGLGRMRREGDYLFVHAGIRPGVAPGDQVEDDLLWIRRPFLSSNSDPRCVVVHGHSIVEEPEIHPNRIAIDTGAYASGVLTALALEGERVEFLR